ncbi:hypothetical protein DEA98_06820 [Brucella pseudogrignonensis]|nr:hypothetical protein [Brucella pseudogrignonensis]
MKTALIAGLIALTPTLAFAEAELADWQKTGLETIKEEKRSGTLCGRKTLAFGWALMTMARTDVALVSTSALF